MKLFLIVAIITLNFLFSCAQVKSSKKMQMADSANLLSNTNYQKQSFDSLILVIEQNHKGSVTYDDLFKIPEFIDIYEHSSFYLKDVINFLMQKQFNIQEKRICICSMQRLDLDSYIQLCKACKAQFDNRKISESLLNWTINPDFSRRFVIARNYREKNVINFLMSLKKDTTISAGLKKSVDDILSGKYFEFIKESGQE